MSGTNIPKPSKYPKTPERKMSEQERQKILNIADMVKGEINRMCVTDDLVELNDMALFARLNIGKLRDMREADIKAERKEE